MQYARDYLNIKNDDFQWHTFKLPAGIQFLEDGDGIGYDIWLVVLTPLKNMKVNWDDDIPYMKWKIKVMLETTNQ